VSVPLAWRNLTADKRRLATSTLGIAFAVLLMLMQLGYRNALVNSQVEVVRQFDADLLMVSAAKYQLNKLMPFPRRRLFQALSVDGITSASPVYMALPSAFWKNPLDHTVHRIRILGVDPEKRVFLSPRIASQVRGLRTPDSMLVDSRCREHIGHALPGEFSELNKRKVHVTGEFSLGTDFQVDGTAIVSDRTFLNVFPDYRAADPQLNRVEIGLLRASSGADIDALVETLNRMLPDDVTCMSREEFITVERDFWLLESPVGLVFNLGTLVGFIVGVVICSQILFSDLAEKMPQFATLKAIGYENRFLRKVVLQQASLLALFGFLPGVAASWCLYQVVGEITGLLMRMGTDLVAIVFGLTLGMCFISGLLAVRKVMAADPADVF
jgi:putative ABC transport system permease protein